MVFLGDDEDDVTNAPNWGFESFDYSGVERVRELHISSPILAAKSPFFYKVNLSMVVVSCCPRMCVCVCLTFCVFFF